MPKLILDKKAYPIFGIALRLAINSGPILSLALGTSHPQTSLSLNAPTAEIEWENGSRLAFQVIGFDSGFGQLGHGTPLRSSLQLIGLVLSEEVSDWFANRPYLETERHLLVYQRQPSMTDEGFLQMLFNNKLGPLSDEQFAKGIFPPFACVVRPTSLNNFTFLQQVVSFIPHIAGWSAFNHINQPLSLITTENEQPLILNQEWIAQKPVILPNYLTDLAQRLKIKRRFEVNNFSRLLVEYLTQESDQGMADMIEAVVKEDRKQLILVPGLVKYYDQQLFCRAVEYAYEYPEGENGDGNIMIDAIAELTPLDSHSSQSWPTHRITGNFEAWLEDRAEYLNFSSSGDWIAMNDKGEPDENRSLVAQAVMPTVPSENHEGIYVRHQPGEPQTILLLPGGIPIALGGVQQKNDAFEAADMDILINAKNLSFISSTKETAPDKAEGVEIKESQIAIRGAGFKVMDEMVVEAGKVNITGNTKIEGNLDVE